jgi:hypothetical protein
MRLEHKLRHDNNITTKQAISTVGIPAAETEYRTKLKLIYECR